MAATGAMPSEQPPSPVANPGQAAAAAETVAVAAAVSVPPSEVGEATAQQPLTPTAQSQPEATVTAQSVPSSSAAPATTGVQPPVQTVTQPTFAELEDNITKRIMDAMSAKLAELVIQQQASQPSQQQPSAQPQNGTTTTEGQMANLNPRPTPGLQHSMLQTKVKHRTITTGITKGGIEVGTGTNMMVTTTTGIKDGGNETMTNGIDRIYLTWCSPPLMGKDKSIPPTNMM